MLRGAAIASMAEIDRTEVTIGDFRRFVVATGTVTQAERMSGGSTYEGSAPAGLGRRHSARAAPTRSPGSTSPTRRRRRSAEHIQSKPFDTAVVYIGFRCARSR